MDDELIEINVSKIVFTIDVNGNSNREALLEAMGYSKVSDQKGSCRYQTKISYPINSDKKVVMQIAQDKLQTILNNFINGYQVIDVELEEPPYLANIRISESMLRCMNFVNLDALHKPNKIGE